MLLRGTYTCVLCKGQTIRTCINRGIRPLLELLDEGGWTGFSAADKVVGKATAYLYVLMGVRSVYAPVMTEAASAILDQYSISHFSDDLTSVILNRQKTGLCPMETAVKDIDDADLALTAIREAFAKL